MKYIDLHVHSSCSDGTFTPKELAEYAAKKGLSAFALTDHDTMDGILEAARAAALSGVELVPGIEFSTDYRGKNIHILGFDLSLEHPELLRKIHSFQEEREERNQEMARRLRSIAGFDLSMEELRASYKDAVITRAHFGRRLLEKGYVTSIQEAFALYIGDDCPCFVPRKHTDSKEAVRLILAAGGIPVLAHPLLYRLSEESLEEMIVSLKSAGLVGLEAIYSANKGPDEANMLRLAKKLDLKISGGSDFHGKNKPLLDLGSGKGNLKIPYEILENLRA